MIDARDGLATLISESGYYQKYIAHQVGLTEQQLTDILKKRRKLDANEMFAFCQVLGVTPNDLYRVKKKERQSQLKGGEAGEQVRCTVGNAQRKG